MPFTREQKEHLVEVYKEGLAQAPHVFLMGFKGVSVPEATELRTRVRETGGKYVVVKNRLALRAIEGAALDGLKQHFQGVTAAVFTSEDAVSVAKALTEFAKDVPSLEFKAGLLDGQEVAPQQIAEIAALPTRDELLGKLVFMLQSPVTRFVRTLNEFPRRVVAVLDQISKAKEA